MNEYTIDKELVRKRFARAADTYNEEASVQAEIVRKMVGLLEPILRKKPENVLEFGCGTGGFTRSFLRVFRPERFWINDLCPEMKERLTDVLELSATYRFLPGDMEQTVIPEHLEAVVSCSALQWFDNPIGFVQHCASKIKKGGYLAFTTFGPQNMQEITSLTDVALHYVGLPAWRQALAKDFHLLVATEDRRQLYFETPVDVLHHLKQTGVNGICSTRWNKTRLQEFSMAYRKKYEITDDVGKNLIPLTYHPIYIIAQKKKTN